MDGTPLKGPVWAIVLAGGRGARFGALKQYLEVGGVRMIDRTVASCRRTCDGVVLVLPEGVDWDGAPVDVVARGGDHQSESLRNALALVPAEVEILVLADPAHPLAEDGLYLAVAGAVRDGADGAVPVVPMLEVVVRVDDGRVAETLPKRDTVVVQAPHAYRADVLRRLHESRPRPIENSSLLVENGYEVRVVIGDPANLHVATQPDLEAVRRLVRETG